MRTRPALAAILALMAAMATAAGPPVPPAPTDFVTDSAGVLRPETRSALEVRLRRFEEETSNQVLVYIAPEIPSGTTLEEFTVAAAEAWGPGGKERDNGLIFFAFPKSRAARIEVGKGLEGPLPDVLAGRILRDEAIPRFSAGDWDGGVKVAVEALIAATKGEYKGTGRRARQGEESDLPWTLILFFLFFVLPVIINFRRRRRYWYVGGGGWGGGSFGGWGGGGGGGGGGFSGGGGSFGGGGASGRW